MGSDCIIFILRRQSRILNLFVACSHVTGKCLSLNFTVAQPKQGDQSRGISSAEFLLIKNLQVSHGAKDK